MLQATYEYDEPIEEWDDVLTVVSGFLPLDLSTMTKDMKDMNVSYALFIKCSQLQITKL